MTAAHPATESARRFLDAVLWGKHLEVWAMLSTAARSTGIALAERKGLDAVVAARARAGTWTEAEADELLTDLVRGLRTDLAAVELAEIIVGEPLLDGDLSADDQPAGTRVKVPMSVPSLLPPELTGGEGWAAGTIDMVRTPAGWFVDRLDARRVRHQ